MGGQRGVHEWSMGVLQGVIGGGGPWVDNGGSWGGVHGGWSMGGQGWGGGSWVVDGGSWGGHRGGGS